MSRTTITKIPLVRVITKFLRKKYLFISKGLRFSNNRSFLKNKIQSNDFLPRIIHVKSHYRFS